MYLMKKLLDVNFGLLYIRLDYMIVLEIFIVNFIILTILINS